MRLKHHIPRSFVSRRVRMSWTGPFTATKSVSTSSPSDVESPPVHNLPRWPQFDLPLLFEIVAGAALAVALVVELGPLRAGILVVVAGVTFFIAYARSKWVQHKFTMVDILAILALAAFSAAVLMPMA